MEDKKKINLLSARAVPLRGNDIDTDRIIPARFLKCVVFDELGPHAFEDDRAALTKQGQVHSFDNPDFKGAGILFVEKNFGCGSSREHAPQSLMRWGIKAIVGVSFAEIFFGNCVSLGIPCVTVSEPQIADLLSKAEENTSQTWKVDLEQKTLTGVNSIAIEIVDGVRDQFLSGDWNPMDTLLAATNEIDKVAKNIPYL